MKRPDTDAQDQLLQIITFGLQRAAGPYRWAMCGRLQVGKENRHVAGLVGAAMCSASHDDISVKS